jgi:hypothetical protein
MTAINYAFFRTGEAQAALIAENIGNVLCNVPSPHQTSRQLRTYWESALLSEGWIKSFSVGASSLSIGYVRDATGLCIQMGNTCRVYADLVKLETVFRLGDIQQAVLAVPADDLSTDLGTNYASFSRAEQDIKALVPTISMPIVLVEIANYRRNS